MVIVANVKILFVAVCHYQLLILFILLSILLWFLTFVIISGFVHFPAEQWDLYGTCAALFSNPVSVCSEYNIANSPRSSFVRFHLCVTELLLGSVEVYGVSFSGPNCERRLTTPFSIGNE